MKEKSRESNFIRHRLRIRLEGFRPERLLSEALERGIVMRQICRIDETQVLLYVSESGFRQLKKMAGSRYRLTMIREDGAEPLLSRLRRSRLMLAGIALFVLFFVSQTFFVREISIIGCKSIPEDSIREVLREEGLYEEGRKNFDCEAVERRLFTEFEDIVWARVAYEGNYVEVQIAESEPAEETESEEDAADGACDIVAEKDCYIEEIQVYAGRGSVKKDDYVKKGEVLISGTVPIEHPSYPLEKDETAEHYVHADGLITARVPYYFSFYMEPGEGQKEAETLLRAWILENVPEDAQIVNKDFHFQEKENIIKVYGIVETREQVGKEKEIVIDRKQRRTEEDQN